MNRPLDDEIKIPKSSSSLFCTVSTDQDEAEFCILMTPLESEEDLMSTVSDSPHVNQPLDVRNSK